MRKYFILFAFIALAASCSHGNLDMVGMFNGQSPDSDDRFKTSQAFNDHHGFSTILVDDDYRVYVCTDTHVDTSCYNLAQFNRAYKRDAACPFAIHLGDLVNADGHYPLFDSAIHIVPEGYVRGKDTLFITPGNHDLYYGQWIQYVEYYKTGTYYFETRSKTTAEVLDLFICLDSANGTLGRRQLAWLKDLLAKAKDKKYRHLIVYTHTHVFKQDATQGHTSNYAMEETYELIGLMSKYGVELVMMGHDHSREVTTYGGCLYIIVDSMQDAQREPYYMVLSVGKRIGYEFVSDDLRPNPNGLK